MVISRLAAIQGLPRVWQLKGAINALAPDFELGLAPENKVSTLDDIFLIGLKIGIGWIGSGRIDGVGWAGDKVVA